jgi:phosphate transport system permease protein
MPDQFSVIMELTIWSMQGHNYHIMHEQSPRVLTNVISIRSLFAIAMTGLTFLAAAIALLPLIAVLGYVLINGSSKINLHIFSQITDGGFGNAILGTIYTVGIAAAIAIPVGVLTAIYLAEFAQDTTAANMIGFLVNVLSGVPSIVVGVFVYAIAVAKTGFSLKIGFSAIAGGIALAILMLPIIVRTAIEALESVPHDLRQAALGLGANNFQTITKIVLPAAMPAITTGVILAIARASGETAPIIFTALFSQYWVHSLLKPTATLSVLIFNYAIVPFKEQQQLAWAGALVIVLLILVANITTRLLIRRR